MRLRRGLTLVELAVVAAILAVLGGLMVPLVTGSLRSSQDTAARAGLAALRDAIMGRSDAPGFYDDIGKLPNSLSDLVVNPFAAGDPLGAWDRESARGWRGPYLQATTGPYVLVPGAGFTTAYGNAGDLAIFDPWGRPIVLQRPDPSVASAGDREQYARLVCAGPDGILQTPTTAQTSTPSGLKPNPDLSVRGDDLVLFLLRPDAP